MTQRNRTLFLSSPSLLALQTFFTSGVFAQGTIDRGPDSGYASKRPILGAACPFCPWGTLADKIKLATKPFRSK
jgi:hypothetical protein